MKTWCRVLTVVTVLVLVWMAGCKTPENLSLHRSRIFLMGRLLAGKTCDMSLIWRAGPNDPAPVTVTADLSAIGGQAEQELTPDNKSIWRWAGQVKPEAFGEQTVLVTALCSDSKEYESEKTVQVYNAAAWAIAIDCGGNQSIALKTDGTVVDLKLGLNDGEYFECYRDEPPFHAPNGLNNVVAVAAGFLNSLALKADGTVVSWSCNGHCFCNFIVPDNLTDVVAIAASEQYDLALKADGTVAQFCENFNCPCLEMPQGLSDVIAVAAGNPCAHALKADGTVVSWMPGIDNDYPNNSCDVPEGIANLVAIDASFNTIALKEDGSVVMWGGSGDRVPFRAGNFRAKAVAAGFGHWMALLQDGTVMIWWKDFSLYYISHTRLKNIIAIADGVCALYSMALTADGSVLAWQEYWYGQSELMVTVLQ